MTIGEIYDLMPEDQRRRAFFLLWGICDFYARGETWVGTIMLSDPPAGSIMNDWRYDEYLGRRAPGGRARLAFAWIMRSFGRIATEYGGSDKEEENAT